LKLGLISDTHGQNSYTERAVEIFRDEAPDRIIHCGDVTKVKHLSPLLALEVPLHVVFGNMDRVKREFEDVANTGAFTLHGDEGQIDVDGQTVAFTHGHMDSALRRLKKRADYLIHGHTHERKDETWKDCRILNPGSVKPPNPSVAILDPGNDEVTFYDLND
jgi:putative phosphoesterase